MKRHIILIGLLGLSVPMTGLPRRLHVILYNLSPQSIYIGIDTHKVVALERNSVLPGERCNFFPPALSRDTDLHINIQGMFERSDWRITFENTRVMDRQSACKARGTVGLYRGDYMVQEASAATLNYGIILVYTKDYELYMVPISSTQRRHRQGCSQTKTSAKQEKKRGLASQKIGRVARARYGVGRCCSS